MVKIEGLQKLTLLDYPGKVACTIFTSGCNFRCPFCHNQPLVETECHNDYIFENKIIAFLKKRQKVLNGVCISGGEPLIQPSIKEFIKKIKTMGYQVKLDTNGSNPILLKELLDEHLVDYVAMDIKNNITKYSETSGIHVNLENIKKSINHLLNSEIDYEFRTTVVKEFHVPDDFLAISQLIKGAKNYYLQVFEDKESVIGKNLHAYNKDEMEKIKELVKPYISNVNIRGI